MLRINGKNYLTIADLAESLGVSPKTARDYINKGIVPKPSKKAYGTRKVDVFSEENIKNASTMLKKYRENKRKGSK